MTRAAPEPDRNLFQQVVARQPAEQIVDALEVVDIDEDHGELAPLGIRAVHELRQSLTK